MKITIFTAEKYCRILHGHVCVMKENNERLFTYSAISKYHRSLLSKHFHYSKQGIVGDFGLWRLCIQMVKFTKQHDSLISHVLYFPINA